MCFPAGSWDTQLLPVPFILDQSDYTPTTNSVVEQHTWANIYWKNIVCKVMLVLVLVILSSSGFTDLCMCLSWSESNSPGFYHFNARGSSCNSLFFGLIISSFLSLLYLFLGIPSSFGGASKYIERERKEARMTPKKRELHELPYTEIVKSGTNRLSSDIETFKIKFFIFLQFEVLHSNHNCK